MYLSSCSRLLRQAVSYRLAVLAHAYAGVSGTFLVPLVCTHEVRKYGASAASPAYWREGASCRCKPQLKLDTLDCALNWATRRLYFALPYSEKGLRIYLHMGSLPADKRGDT